MHIEEGVVTGAKIILSYATAATVGVYALKQAAGDLRAQGLDLRVGPGTALGAMFHDEFTSDFHGVIVRRSHRVPIDVFPGSKVVRDPARRAQPAAHTTRVWTGPAGCPVAPSSPRLCLRPDAACGLAEDSLKRRRRQEVRKTKQPTASSQIPW